MPLSFYEDNESLYEEIIQDGRPTFACYEKKTSIITYANQIELPDNKAIVPVWGKEITEGAVTLPTGVQEYGETLALVDKLDALIAEYIDIPQVWREFSVWYILMSWVYEKLNTLSYLRFSGDTGCGKSQALNVIGRLCYKPMMMAGAVTPAPIYRIITKFRGTLIMEEADIKESDEDNEVVKILNSGFQRGRPIIRCTPNNPDELQILPCFGPKVFATRFKFNDIALEARCMSVPMIETNREEIPEAEGKSFENKLVAIRKNLLMWRFKHLNTMDSEKISTIDVGKVEPRLKQIGRSFALPFSENAEVMVRFRAFMQNIQKDLIVERSDSLQGRVVQALFKLAKSEGRNNVTPGMLSGELSSEYKVDVKSSTLGKILTSLRIERSHRRINGVQGRYIIWSPTVMMRHLRRYFSPADADEYRYLLSADDSADPVPEEIPAEPVVGETINMDI